ncbi:ABC transporter permease [Hufsiella ginkgonis]|uniref:Transport permease protein n=1 Tax=Hufsiella ginkgonis TaxID=2695274 RepID=A0A7K1Y2G4_9SPHI|nr:ABC transporter permease [Hufsiella ginkgonis]MXV17474.1 ABC transporter permease [Hufsiella ginkgonis]
MKTESASKSHTDTWDLEIKPAENIFNLHLKDVWNYRDLLWLLVRRDFVSFYKQTLLGPLWFFIQPIFTIFIYSLVFNKFAQFGTNGAPAPLFYLTGIVAWTYFSDCLVKTSTVFRDNAAMFGKVYFPRLIMPLSIVMSNLVKFGMQLVLMVLLYLWYLINGKHIAPNIYILLFPVVVFIMAILGLGLGLIVTAMTTKYRDLAFAVSFGMQLFMYATPVIYPLADLAPKYKAIVSLNPMTGVIETLRYGVLDAGHFYSGAFLYSVLASLAILLLGLVIFNKVEKNFVDTV